jgi:hypothetical protein
VTEATRNQPQVQTSAALRVTAGLSFALGILGVLFWVPSLFVSTPAPAGFDLVSFSHSVANVAVQQYTPNMRWVVPILGGLVTLASVAQIPAAIGAWMGRESWLLVLRVVAYLKAALFITSGLLLGLALFSSVAPHDQPWTFALSSWLIIVGMVAIYFWMIGVINHTLAAMHRESDRFSDDPDEDDEDDEGLI